jgi:hypothetical protein
VKIKNAAILINLSRPYDRQVMMDCCIARAGFKRNIETFLAEMLCELMG